MSLAGDNIDRSERPLPLPVPTSHHDSLLLIFRHLPLRDCLRCKLVCRSWKTAVSEHFRTLTRLTFVSKDETQILVDEQSCTEPHGPSLMEMSLSSGNTSPKGHSLPKGIYERFNNILAFFPSVRTLTLRNQPFDDVFFGLIATRLPQLQQVHLYSCWNESTAELQTSALVHRHIFAQLAGATPTASRTQHDRFEAIQKYLSDLSYNNSPILRTNYSLLTFGFPALTHLTLANCNLTDQCASAVIKSLPQLSYLNIMNNDKIEGSCLVHLGENCKTICAGSFNLQVLIIDLLAGIARSPGARQLRQLELTGCLMGGGLHQLESLPGLETLVLHFYCHNYVSQSFESIAQLHCLKRLILQQEYSYEEASVIDHQQLCTIIAGCRQLQRLEILGEFGWRLRLSNASLDFVAKNSSLLQLSISGNATSITDCGIMKLGQLNSLECLQLTSFEHLHDQSIEHLLEKLPNLKELLLKDNHQLSGKTLELVVAYAFRHPQRPMKVCLDERQFSAFRVLWRYALSYVMDRWLHWWHWWSDTQFDHLVEDWLSDHRKQLANQVINENEAVVSAPTNSTTTTTPIGSPAVGLKGHLCATQERPRWPPNLNVIFNESVRSYKYDINELTPLRFMTILLVSLLILTMMAVTLFVVVVLPALMSAYFLFRQSFRLFNLLWLASTIIADQMAVFNGTFAIITTTVPANNIDIDLFVDG